MLVACTLIGCFFAWAYPMEFDYKLIDTIIRVMELPKRADRCSEKYNEYSYLPALIALMVSHLVILIISWLAGKGKFKTSMPYLTLLQTNFTQMK